MPYKLFTILLLSLASSNLCAMSQRVEFCAAMATVAHEIVSAKSTRPEQAAMEMNKQHGLPQMQVDRLDGLVKLVYSIGTKMRSEDVAAAMYAACAAR
jgi:hypothetical protein